MKDNDAEFQVLVWKFNTVVYIKGVTSELLSYRLKEKHLLEYEAFICHTS